MKIATIIAPSATDFGLNIAAKLACDTLTETGEVLQIFNLDTLGVGVYDGVNVSRANDIMDAIKAADGIIFTFSALFGMPSAAAVAFLEYFCHDAYKGALDGKPCLLMSISESGNERAALEAVSGGILKLGGFDVVRIGIDVSVASITQNHVIELIERQAEDFYRILRQNRRYVLPQKQDVRPQPQAQYQDPVPVPIPTPEPRRTPTYSVDEIYKKHNLDNISGSQQEDINKISAIFAKKYVSESDAIVEQKQPVPITTMSNTGFGGERNTKQLTASLPHHFNTQLAKDMETVIQLNITGMDGFTGFIAITNQECFFGEGEADKNDITVIADAKVWGDVLRKKITAQKAFMMGQLKVRGNFVLLTKFDQLFNALT